MDTVFCSGRDMTTPLTNWYDSFHPVSSALCWNITSECREVQCWGFFLGQEYNNCHDFRFKKAWNWLQNHKTIVYMFTLDITFLSKSKAWLHNIALQIEKKIMNHTWLWLCNKKRNSSLKFNIHNAPHAKSEVSSFHS